MTWSSVQRPLDPDQSVRFHFGILILAVVSAFCVGLVMGRTSMERDIAAAVSSEFRAVSFQVHNWHTGRYIPNARIETLIGDIKVAETATNTEGKALVRALPGVTLRISANEFLPKTEVYDLTMGGTALTPMELSEER